MGRGRQWVSVAAATVAALAIAWWAWSGSATPSDLDGRFAALTAGMSRAEVEGVLGGPTGSDGDATIRRVAGFRAVDLPPIDRLPTPRPVRLWWHDGRDRCLYVEYSADRVWRAALFGPGWEKRIGG